ncbi:hybrid sensor histidine kinase/response regulator [Maribellus luteus]|uniref:histidine kinase n=1 Tax=Maribellus luteus TaxID=2305463 RepID=A0A399SV23_9BACT|nr:hybrid sensor histidine kinase/response regulator transcription factor [Maribellus luteus]RIJ47886.1 hybrid sensor histidine kinase/response regulator [Maribellus luteus]
MHAIFLFILTNFNLFILDAYRSNTFSQEHFQQESTHISNLNIKSFCQDSLGYMWIATPRGLNRFNGYEFVQYYHDPKDSSTIDNDFVLSLYLDSSHRLWVGTVSGVNCFNFKTEKFEHYPLSTKRIPYTLFFYEDHKKNIWIATQVGPAYLDSIKKQVILEPTAVPLSPNLIWEDESKRLWMGMDHPAGLAMRNTSGEWELFSLPDNKRVLCKYNDPQGFWWLGTDTGIVLFDPILRQYKDLPKSLKDNTLICHSQINFIQEISPLKLLIGTASQGFFHYDILSQSLSHNLPQALANLQSSHLLSCTVDKDKNIWIGSFDKGFKVWNNSLNFFNSDQDLSNTFKDKFVTQLVEDDYGNLWISTRYYGLFHYSGSGKLTNYNFDNSHLFSSNNCLIESLSIDSKNRLWIGLTDQLVVAGISKEGLLNIIARKNIKMAGAIKTDLSGNIWIGSTSGLYKIKRGDISDAPQLIFSGNIPEVFIINDDSLLFSSFNDGVYFLKPDQNNDIIPLEALSLQAKRIIKNCITIYQDKQGYTWLGSYGNGALRFSPDFKHHQILDKQQGLPSNDILAFEQDNHGYIWMSTSFGISKLNVSDTTIVNYFGSDGTLGNQFHEKAKLKHSDGRIFFAGNHGLTFFNPLFSLSPKNSPVVQLTDFKILNQSIKPSSNSVLPQSIPFVKQITLNHRQNVFSIDYTGIDFLFSSKLTYAYKLEGFERDWNYVGNYRRATYSNLKPGKYLFKVKAFNGEGQECLAPATLRINIKSAPWFSWPAWVIYIFTISGIVYILFKLILKTRLNQHQLEAEQKERERERQISNMKVNFFTNISHEIRTPLTLISAPLQQLSTSNSFSEKENHLLKIISKNVHSMLRLINQLLDFNKMENGMFNLKVQQTDIIQFVKNIHSIFLDTANRQQLTLSFTHLTPSLFLWIDTDKVEKVLYNLLSNAIKFTPRGGMVHISLNIITPDEAKQHYQAPSYSFIEIIVKDNGPGIPNDKLHELFIRYRQINELTDKVPGNHGSGIGLNYSKRLVEAHNGKIKAINCQEGGMQFSFILPMGDIYPESNKITEEKEIQEIIPIKQEEKITDKKNKDYTILLAEDNTELRSFIRSILSGRYELIEAPDGLIAWSLIQSNSPDLIISDVLMPGLSGYELCNSVKRHPEFSHIPIILLTAKTSVNEQLEGLELGADAYICKPFNLDYLLLTVKNIFTSRNNIRKYYSEPSNSKVETPPPSLGPHDQNFMDKLIQIIQKDLANPDLNIDSIARELGFSRTGFYRKIKGLSDMPPNDFIRTYRLKRAAELIREQKLSLIDVANNTGFNHYPYFSKSFKKQFGVSPKDYA